MITLIKQKTSIALGNNGEGHGHTDLECKNHFHSISRETFYPLPLDYRKIIRSALFLRPLLSFGIDA